MWKCVYRKRRNDRKTINDMLPRVDGRGQRRYDGRNAVSVTVSPPMRRRFSRPENSVGAFHRRPRPGAGAEHPAAVLERDLELVALKKTRSSPQTFDLAVKFSLAPYSR